MMFQYYLKFIILMFSVLYAFGIKGTPKLSKENPVDFLEPSIKAILIL